MEAGTAKEREEELGDLLFALVNFSRHAGIDAEQALRKTSDKFCRRFAHVEARVKQVHGGWGDAGSPSARPLDELDGYWEEAKAMEREASKG
jgi:tetrapyrrole methylase family protein/MazG family protein/ATP diphosphatase